jgi:pyrophosphate--fructose-6-phosphate 1-phosphotransferase
MAPKGDKSDRSKGSQSDRSKKARKKKKAPMLSSISIAEDVDEDEAEAALAAALLAEVLRPARAGPPPNASYMMPLVPTARENSADTPRPPRLVAVLTAGDPCEDLGFAATVEALIDEYAQKHPSIKLLCYTNGFEGILLNQSVALHAGQEWREQVAACGASGGSPIGASRVVPTDAAECVRRGLCAPEEDPMRRVANRLRQDGVDVLHVIGGHAALIAAAAVAIHLEREHYSLTAIGLPHALENDESPITQLPGAWTAADQSARFFARVRAETTAAVAAHMPTSTLHVHEVAGGGCGWLTAATSAMYRDIVRMWPAEDEQVQLLGPEGAPSRARWDLHAVYVPEMARAFDLAAEAARLAAVVVRYGQANVFVAEGVAAQLSELWPLVHAQRVAYHKSGDAVRGASANAADARLITASAQVAAHKAVGRQAGVVALDEEGDDPWRLRLISFERLQPCKPFDLAMPWFSSMLVQIGQVEKIRPDLWGASSDRSSGAHSNSSVGEAGEVD